MRTELIVCIILLLSACQHVPATQPEATSAGAEDVQPELPPINAQLLSLGDVPETLPIFELTEEQREQFLYTFHNELSDLPPHRRVSEYLKQLTRTYNYRERTVTASEAFDGAPGNCMSLVVLTTALAQLVDLEIDYQRLTTNPVFDKQGSVVLVSDHVRSRVFAPRKERGINILRAHVLIDYFPVRQSRRAERLQGDQLLAMYYTNRAAESILDDELATATHFATLALEQVPDHVGAFNLLGILHERIDDNATAEAFYLHGLKYNSKDLNVLSNYHSLLSSQSRYDKASDIKKRIAALNDVNPYQLIALAQRAFQNSEPRRALGYYEKALEIAPYIHEVYFQQAVVWESIGHGHRASESLREGLAQAELSATQTRYKQQMRAVKANTDNAW